MSGEADTLHLPYSEKKASPGVQPVREVSAQTDFPTVERCLMGCPSCQLSLAKEGTHGF